MNWPTLPAPAGGQDPGAQLLEAVVVHGQVDLVALLEDGAGADDPGVAGPGHPDHPPVAVGLQLLDLPAGPLVGQDQGDQGDLGVGVAPVRGDLVGDQHPHHLVGGPLDGGHGGDAEALVDLGPAGVVDAGHHHRGLELLPGQTGGHDVGVVAAGHGRERLGPLDPGRPQHVLVEPVALDLLALEAVAQRPEGVGVLVDHRDRVLGGLQPSGQLGAHPAAAHDHHVHGRHPTVPCQPRWQG